MATESGAGVMIDIVLDEGDALLRAECFQRGLQQLVAGDVVGHDIPQTQAFRRGVFDMPHVEIEATAVEQEPAISRRLFVIAVMKVDRARPGIAEEEVLHLHWPGLGAPVVATTAWQAAVFRFEPSDPIHALRARSPSHTQATRTMVRARSAFATVLRGQR